MTLRHAHHPTGWLGPALLVLVVAHDPATP